MGLPIIVKLNILNNLKHRPFRGRSLFALVLWVDGSRSFALRSVVSLIVIVLFFSGEGIPGADGRHVDEGLFFGDLSEEVLPGLPVLHDSY